MTVPDDASAWELVWPGSDVRAVTNNPTLKQAWERGYVGDGAIIRPLFPKNEKQMSEMIDRVARAIAKAEHMEDNEDRLLTVYTPLARAAIEAMREPTEDQLRAAWAKVDYNIDDFWRAMIDAALSE